jgi:hypothetical protein
MLSRETIAVYFLTHKKLANKLYGKNTQFFLLKTGDTTTTLQQTAEIIFLGGVNVFTRSGHQCNSVGLVRQHKSEVMPLLNSIQRHADL